MMVQIMVFSMENPLNMDDLGIPAFMEILI